MLAGVLALAGCGPSASPSPSVAPTSVSLPSPAGSIDPSAAQAVYAEVAGQVEDIRGLTAKGDISPVLIDEATLRKNLTAEFDRENPAALVRANQQILTALGLLDPGTSLRDAYLDLQSGQVIGYYSPDEDSLFLVSRSGSVGPIERATYAHEFTHQLQDQHFDLDKLGLDATDQGDRSTARLALVEGDAVATQSAWMQAELSPAELIQVVAAAGDPEASAALARAPAILRETLMFPYFSGQTFVNGLMVDDGYQAVNDAFASPPASTEQVLHPEKYLSGEEPDVVTLPKGLAAALGRSWRLAAQDTLGELVLRIWLAESGVTGTAPTTAAEGWGGDRLALLRGPHGEVALVIVTRWDTAADAAEFAQAAGAAATHMTPRPLVVVGDGRPEVTIGIAPDEGTLGKLLVAVGL
jgi:hypothetical protein